MSRGYKAVWRNGELLAEYEHGKLTFLSDKYSAPKRSTDVAAPTVIRDIDEYRSPLDGSMVTSRSQHRDHIRAHDVVEVGNEPIGSMKANTDRAEVAVDRDLGEAIKHRIEEVKAMPQASYDEHIQKQAFEHAEVASLITATE